MGRKCWGLEPLLLRQSTQTSSSLRHVLSCFNYSSTDAGKDVPLPGSVCLEVMALGVLFIERP